MEQTTLTINHFNSKNLTATYNTNTDKPFLVLRIKEHLGGEVSMLLDKKELQLFKSFIQSL